VGSARQAGEPQQSRPQSLYEVIFTKNELIRPGHDLIGAGNEAIQGRNDLIFFVGVSYSAGR
jgi:hypothetical protein